MANDTFEDNISSVIWDLKRIADALELLAERDSNKQVPVKLL